MMETTDHFNYPTSQRKDTMYLSTISTYFKFPLHNFLLSEPEETGFRQIKAHREFSSSLYTSDIDKARPYLPGYAFGNKPHFMNRNDDIEGSRPSKHHQPLDKPNYSLTNEDIFGAKPRATQFTTTRQPTNPLVPEYKLPYCEVRATTPPKFIRDQIDIKVTALSFPTINLIIFQDIDGARPNPYTKYTYNDRTMNVSDIDRAWPRKKWIVLLKSA